MHRPPSPSRPHQLLALALVVAISATVLGCRDTAVPPVAPTATTAAATISTSAQASVALLALPELRAWSTYIETASNGSARGAVIENDPAPRLVDGKPYYQLSFVENGKDSMHRWQSFLVGQDGTILVENDDGDTPLTLARWRAEQRPMERVRPATAVQ